VAKRTSRALDEDQLNLLPEIRSVITTAFEVAPDAQTISELAGRAEAAVKAAHPGLTDDAVRAVGALYAFDWK
jgi:hypothetical protein